MARLTEDQKVFIVGRLACFHDQAEVAAEARDVFGIDVDRRQVHFYDPTAPASRTPKKWVELFDATRAAYLKARAEVGISHKRYRLEQLQRMYDRAMRMGPFGNIPLALSILEQAAKEDGGMYSNRHQVQHSGQVKTTGVLLIPERSAEEWSKAARANQQTLEDEAEAATASFMSRAGGRA